jgi:hypothetical protein
MSDLSPLCEQKRTSTICDKTLHFPWLTTATGYKPAVAPLRRSDPAAEGHHDHTPSGNSHSEKRQCSLATCTTTFAVQLSLLSVNHYPGCSAARGLRLYAPPRSSHQALANRLATASAENES